jgi:FkbM family methyltransferase
VALNRSGFVTVGTLALLVKAPHRLRGIALRATIHSVRLPLIRTLLSRSEIRSFKKLLERTTTPGPVGGAIGYLFDNHDPELSARDVYRDVFSPRRFSHGYQSQMGQDMFLNRWFFKNQGPGFFVDVGAFDGILGSNTSYFEKHLHWKGIAFEPNSSAFEILQASRSCIVVRGCAYDHDGQIPFLTLSERQQREHIRSHPPASLLELLLDPQHGGSMLSGIPQHMGQDRRVEWASKAMGLDQIETTVPCHRIDTLLSDSGVDTVDYLSVDVEGAELEVLRGIDFERVQVNVIGVEHSPTFSEVYELLTASGFEYRGLLFFDEIFVNTHPRYSWDGRR